MQASSSLLSVCPLTTVKSDSIACEVELSKSLTMLRAIDGIAENFSSLFRNVLERATTDYVILYRPEVILEEGLPEICVDVIDELSRSYPNWGVCGACGVRWDGGRTYRYVRRPPFNSQAGAAPRPVVMVGSELLLLNVNRLREAKITIPKGATWVEIGPLLALECLKTDLMVLVDRRLMAVDMGKAPELKEAQALHEACRRSLLNHRLDTPYGSVEISDMPFDRHLALPPERHEQRDLIACFDSALAKARDGRPLSLTVACRSQLNRPMLLERAMLSFAAAQEECPDFCTFQVRLVSDQPRTRLADEVASLRERFPGLSLDGVHVSSRSKATSRIDHLLTAIEEIDTDYVWFIDDDDFVMPGAVPSLARVLLPDAPVLLVGNSETYEEVWKNEELRSSNLIGIFPSHRIFEVFTGENYVPICGMVLPARLARERCRDVEARGEYLEDFFVLLRLLTSPRIEVETLPYLIAGISLRGNENTVRETKRDTWERSYAEFVSEILRRNDSSNPLLWQLSGQS